MFVHPPRRHDGSRGDPNGDYFGYPGAGIGATISAEVGCLAKSKGLTTARAARLFCCSFGLVAGACIGVLMALALPESVQVLVVFFAAVLGALVPYPMFRATQLCTWIGTDGVSVCSRREGSALIRRSTGSFAEAATLHIEVVKTGEKTAPKIRYAFVDRSGIEVWSHEENLVDAAQRDAGNTDFGVALERCWAAYRREIRIPSGDTLGFPGARKRRYSRCATL